MKPTATTAPAPNRRNSVRPIASRPGLLGGRSFSRWLNCPKAVSTRTVDRAPRSRTRRMLIAAPVQVRTPPESLTRISVGTQGAVAPRACWRHCCTSVWASGIISSFPLHACATTLESSRHVPHDASKASIHRANMGLIRTEVIVDFALFCARGQYSAPGFGC